MSEALALIAELRARISELEHGKTSKNSSLPPSKDENGKRKNRSLRERTGKKTGGQPGHKGYKLKMVDNPDRIENHIADYCEQCGVDLQAIPANYKGRRQEIDLPPIVPIVTEHRIYTRHCGCGHCNEGDYPAHIRGEVNYGTNIITLIAYMSVYQYISYRRIAQFMAQVFGISISEGTVANKLRAFAFKCAKPYEMIRQRLEKSSVIGSDETSCQVDGEKHWMWTWQNDCLTYIAHSATRAYSTITQHFKDGFQWAVLVSDCLAAQLKTRAKAHQICLAHLRRELEFFIEKRNNTWSYQMNVLLLKAIRVKDEFGDQGYAQKVDTITTQIDRLLANPPPQKIKKLQALYRRMVKNKNALLIFLQYQNVPPDNNGSERAIRNIKVKQKVSGFFKTNQGADQFAMIRSIIDTTLKNKGNVFDACRTISLISAE